MHWPVWASLWHTVTVTLGANEALAIPKRGREGSRDKQDTTGTGLNSMERVSHRSQEAKRSGKQANRRVPVSEGQNRKGRGPSNFPGSSRHQKSRGLGSSAKGEGQQALAH